MQSKFISLSILLFSLLFSSQLLAADACEMPPDIDDDKFYRIKFEGVDEHIYKILDVEDCWVHASRKGYNDGGGNWFPIDGIQYIAAKAFEPKD